MKCSASVEEKKYPDSSWNSDAKKKKSFLSLFFLKDFFFFLNERLKRILAFVSVSKKKKNLAESDLETSILSFQMHILKMEIKKKKTEIGKVI